MKNDGSRTGFRLSRYFPLYLLLGPTIVLLMIFNYYPAFLAVFRSFFQWDIGTEPVFIGLRNFSELFRDDIFLKSLINILKLTVFTVIVNLAVPLFVAEIIFNIRSKKWNYFFRVLFVVPMVVPSIVVWVIWKFIYSDAGFLTVFLEAIGKQEWVYGWLTHPHTALLAIAFVGFPFAYGFNILVLYAGLSNIPQSILDSARIDGCSPLQSFYRIHLPMIVSQVKLLIVITLITVIQGFETVYILTTDGGPGYETMLPGLYMFFNGFTYKRMGYACAIGVVLFVIMLAVTIFNNKYVRSTQEFDPGKN